DRQAAAVTNAAVAADRLKALQVGGDLTSKVAFERPLVLGDDLEDPVELLFAQVLRTGGRLDAGFLNDLVGPLRADAVDVAKRVRDLLLRGDINAEETWHKREGV